MIQILGQGNNIYTNNGIVEFADHPIENELTWEDLLYGESKFNSDSLLPHVPFNVKSEIQMNKEFDKNLENIPSWFGQTALWWAEGNLSDEEFLQSINYLRERGLINPYFDFRFLFND